MKKRIAILGLLTLILFNSKSSSDDPVSTVEFKPEHQARHQVFIKKIPEDITFAGEKVHFKTPDAYKKFERELKMNTRNNSSTRLLLKNARVWLPEISKILIANKIPEDFKFLAIAESNLSNVISHRGAAGFWQITYGTGLHLGLEINDEVDERYHPIKATRAACRYFKEAHRQFGDWTSAAAAYNRGINGLKKAFASQKATSYYDLELNDETSRYLYRILSIKDVVSNPGKYGLRQFRYTGPAYSVIIVDSSIPDLELYAKDNNINYELLKEYNPWLLKNSLTIKGEGKTYTLLVPKRQQFLFRNEYSSKKDTSGNDS